MTRAVWDARMQSASHTAAATTSCLDYSINRVVLMPKSVPKLLPELGI